MISKKVTINSTSEEFEGDFNENKVESNKFIRKLKEFSTEQLEEMKNIANDLNMDFKQ